MTFPRFVCPGPKRAAPDPPPNWGRFLADTVAAYPDWPHLLEEDRRRIEMDARIQFNNALDVERVILRDVVYPRPRDAFGYELDEDDLY